MQDAAQRTGRGQPTVLLPIAIDSGARFHIPIIDVEITVPDGTRIEAVHPSPNRHFDKIDLTAYPFFTSNSVSPDWLTLSFSRSAWEHVKNARVHITGTVAIEYYHPGRTTILPTQGSGEVADLGRCTTLTTDDGRTQAFKLECESPRELPAAVMVLRHEASGREWKERLSSSITYMPGPHETWLSPLHRGESFFHLVDVMTPGPGSQWLVPASDLPSARLEITPEIVTGHALARFDFPGVALSTWLVHGR